jgi:hypothetical protein
MRVRIARAALSALLALVAIVIMNALFFAASLYAASASSATRVDAVRLAFTIGELVDKDYLKTDWRRGKNQYNDCVVLQLVINSRSSVVEKALAPIFYVSDVNKPDVCRSLRRLASSEAGTAGMFGDSYSRYWHGYVPLTSALLTFTDVGTIRQGLRIFVVCALLALLVAAGRAGGAIRIAGVSVGATGLLFWGLPYYGQGLSFAPGDALVIVGITALVVLRKRLQNSKLIVFSAVYGSLIAYFDFLTGPIPTGACLLFLFTYLARFEVTQTEVFGRAWANAFVAVAAYTFGAVLTVAIRQLLVLAVLGPGELHSFIENARLYMGLDDPGALPAAYAGAFFNLFKYTPLLTLHSNPGGAALLLCFALAWVGAASLAIQSASPAVRSIFLAHAIGASGIALWVLLLPTHTATHGFMVRMLVVPFAFGWSALALTLLASKPRAARRE